MFEDVIKIKIHTYIWGFRGCIFWCVSIRTSSTQREKNLCLTHGKYFLAMYYWLLKFLQLHKFSWRIIFFKVCILGEYESVFSHWDEKEQKSIAQTHQQEHLVNFSTLVCLKTYSSNIIQFLFTWAFFLRVIYLWSPDQRVSFFYIVINWHLGILFILLPISHYFAMLGFGHSLHPKGSVKTHLLK